MTTLAHRSALGGPKNGGVAARRAVVRWAWRMFRREWRQQILVTCAPHRRGRGRDRQRHGRLQLGPRGGCRVRLGRSAAPVRRRRSAPAGGGSRRRRGAVRDDRRHRPPLTDRPRRRRQGRVPRPGPARGVRWRALALRRGSYPNGADEVAVTDGVATLLGLEIGKTLALDGRRRTVVGIVENPRI